MDPGPYIAMELRQIFRDGIPSSPQRIVLAEEDAPAGRAPRTLTIFIGLSETEALERAVKGIGTSRPLTHDLVLNALEALGGRLTRVLVTAVENDTFHGALEVTAAADGKKIYVDSRPSDALVLAARRDVPIAVALSVLAESSGEGQGPPDEGG